MNRLRNKLKRRREDRAEGAIRPNHYGKDSKTELLSQLQQKMDRIASKKPKKDFPKKSEGQLPLAGEELETEFGPVLTIEKRFPISYRHGNFGATQFLLTGKSLGALAHDERLSPFDPMGAVFLDTETTGLSGGTGTLPFLVGIGGFAIDETFVVKQFFCREPSEEPAQLAALAVHLEKATSLVTFNGKAFDLPLLNTRYVLNRLKNPGAQLPHLDLLHIARRVFKRRLKSCSLGSLEDAVLGFLRVGDIPGSEIPAAYRIFLRGGPVEPMESVLDHNALDLVGLAALAAVLEQMYENPEQVEHAADHLGLAKSALHCGDQETAATHLQRAGTSESAQDIREAHTIAAKNASKRGEYHIAIDHWRQALDVGPNDPHVHLALAKLYEHREKDYDSALKHAAHTEQAEGKAGSDHRIARLNRRKSKTYLE